MVATDLASLTSLLAENLASNGISLVERFDGGFGDGSGAAESEHDDDATTTDTERGRTASGIEEDARNGADAPPRAVVAPLKWGDATALAALRAHAPFDLIVCCDCCYDSAAAEPLAEVTFDTTHRNAMPLAEVTYTR